MTLHFVKFKLSQRLHSTCIAVERGGGQPAPRMVEGGKSHRDFATRTFDHRHPLGGVRHIYSALADENVPKNCIRAIPLTRRAGLLHGPHERYGSKAVRIAFALGRCRKDAAGEFALGDGLLPACRKGIPSRVQNPPQKLNGF